MCVSMCVYEGEGVTVGRYMFVGERGSEKSKSAKFMFTSRRVHNVIRLTLKDFSQMKEEKITLLLITSK